MYILESNMAFTTLLQYLAYFFTSDTNIASMTNQTTPEEAKPWDVGTYKLINNFTVMPEDSCNSKGVYGLKNGSVDYFSFMANETTPVKKNKASMKKCFDLHKQKVQELEYYDFCKNFFTIDYSNSADCHEYQEVLKEIPVNHPGLIILGVGKVENITIFAGIPRDPCSVLIVQSFMEEAVNRMVSLYENQLEMENEFAENPNILQDTNPPVESSQETNKLRSSDDNPRQFSIKGVRTLLYLLAQQMRCLDPEVLPINIKEDLNEIEKINDECHVFDFNAQPSDEKNTIIIIFDIKKRGVPGEKRVGELYGVTSMYANNFLTYKDNFIRELKKENSLLDTDSSVCTSEKTLIGPGFTETVVDVEMVDSEELGLGSANE